MEKFTRCIRFTFLVAILLMISSVVQAQKETEVFIPLGKSPGVSGKYSVIGKIEAVNVQDSIITIDTGAGNKSIRITTRCAIYLDKSRRKLTNTKGSWADLKTGLLAEVKYRNNEPGNLIEWLKVQPE